MRNILTAMATILAVAIVVIAAAPATNEAATGDFDNPTNIIGEEGKFYDIGPGVSTEIKFNRTSFVAAPQFKVYIGEEAQTAGTPITLGEVKLIGGFNFKISKADETKDDGTYAVSITSDGTSAGIKFKIGVSITESWEGLTTTQQYFWGGNIKAEFVEAVMTLKEGGTALTTGEDATHPYFIGFDQNVDITIETVPGTFYYYATGLPAGLSVTTNGHIAGKLSKDVLKETESFFTVTAVNGNTILTKQVFYKIGTKPDDSNLTFKVNGADSPEYVLVNSGEMVTVTEIKINETDIDMDKLTVSFTPNGGQTPTKDGSQLIINPGTGGLGSFRVDLTYDTPEFKTVTKSFQVFVVGGIYDANIDPVVHGNP